MPVAALGGFLKFLETTQVCQFSCTQCTPIQAARSIQASPHIYICVHFVQQISVAFKFYYVPWDSLRNTENLNAT